MMDNSEDQVSRFYNTVGWRTKDGIAEDTRRWEDLREHAREYVSRCRLRVLRHIPARGESILDMGSGPIPYAEYVVYSRNFAKRYCVDLSADALDQARRKIGDHGVFLHGNFLDIPMQDDFFDCAFSLHTIYHIEAGRQEEAVRKLLRVTMPGRPVIIVYSNPDALVKWRFPFVTAPARLARRLLHAVNVLCGRMPAKLYRRLRRTAPALAAQSAKAPSDDLPLYFHAHPLQWWSRFSDEAVVKILPWRFLDSDTQKKLIPDNASGARIFKALFALEERFPSFFARHGQYPLIILTKKNAPCRTPKGSSVEAKCALRTSQPPLEYTLAENSGIPGTKNLSV
jgi:ubiquinone/menaquinone biosynthesis C-methylase UbiE